MLGESVTKARFGKVGGPWVGRRRFEGCQHPQGREPAGMPIPPSAQGVPEGRGLQEFQGFR